MVLIQDIREEDYRALDIESFSSFKYLLDSPQEWLRQKENKFTGNAATRLGTSIHMYLQGDKDKVVQIPTFKKLLKNGTESKFDDKQAQEDWLKANPSVQGTDEDGVFVCEEIYKLAQSNGILDLLSQYQMEQAYLFERNGLKFKGRLDCIKPNHIIDIKTTSKSIDRNSFKNIIYTSNYDMQLAMYQSAHGENAPCSIIAVKTTYPYEIRLYHISQNTLDMGYKKWDICIDRYLNKDKLLLTYLEDTI